MNTYACKETLETPKRQLASCILQSAQLHSSTTSWLGWWSRTRRRWAAELAICNHVSSSRTAQTFCHLRRLRFIRRHLGRDVAARRCLSLRLRPMATGLYYCTAPSLAGFPASWTLALNVPVLCTAVRFVLYLRPRDHVSCRRPWSSFTGYRSHSHKLCLLRYVCKSSLGRTHTPVYITIMLKPAADVPWLWLRCAPPQHTSAHITIRQEIPGISPKRIRPCPIVPWKSQSQQFYHFQTYDY